MDDTLLNRTKCPVKLAGTWAGDAGIAEFREEIEQYRHALDSEKDISEMSRIFPKLRD